MKDVRLHDIDDRRNGSGRSDGSGGPDGSDVEARLRGLTGDLVGDVVAPPFDGVRQAIGRRARVLRRRRHVRRAATGGILAVAAAVAAVMLQPARPEVQVHPAAGGAGPRAMVTLDLAGWTLERAEEQVVDFVPSTDPTAVVQVFRVPDRLDGPLVHLEHSFATDVFAAAPGDAEVDIDGSTGYIAAADATVHLRWNPASTDSEAELTAFGLDENEVLAFARSLEPIDERDREGEIATGPAGTGTGPLGFVATSAPRGIEEVDPVPEGPSPVTARRSLFVREAGAARGTVEIRADVSGEAFETSFDEAEQRLAWDAPERVTVLGRQALLQHGPDGDPWVVEWEHAEDTWVRVTIDPGVEDAGAPAAAALDRDTVDQVIANLEELPEAGWRDALASTTAD